MADINSKIAQLNSLGYFKEMKTVTLQNGKVAVYVVITFPSKWIVDETITDKYGVSVMKKDGSFWFCGDITSDLESIYDAIELCIEENKAAEERARLFEQKIAELRNLFEDENNSLEALRTLEFTFPTFRKKRGKTVELPAPSDESGQSLQDSETNSETNSENNEESIAEV